MNKYIYAIAALTFCLLAGLCGGLYGANAKLKAEISALSNALKTCEESNRTLESGRKALLAQLTKQEKTCRERTARIKDAYYSLMIEEKNKCDKPPGVIKNIPSLPPRISAEGTSLIRGTPPPTVEIEDIGDRNAERVPSVASVRSEAGGEIMDQVISYETSVSVITVLNNTFGVLRSDSVQDP